MLINNFRFSLRHLSRQRLNTALHIVGLTLAMSVCLLIGLFLRDELGFDNQISNGDRIYRVNSAMRESQKAFDLYATPLGLAEAIRSEVTGVEKTTLVRAEFKSIVEVTPQKIFKQEHILIVEPAFLEMFDVNVVQGEPSAFKKPYQALLNETTARKFFGAEDPVGKTFKYRSQYLITVAGVFRDLPANSHLPATMLLSFVANDEFLGNGDTWYFGDFAWAKLAASTYIQTSMDADLNNIQSQLKVLADRHVNSAPTLDKNIHGDYEIQALSAIHFDTQRFGGGPWVPAMSRSWLWFFAGIGLVVLLLACINFLNLSTAQALRRSKEIGIRKTIGARRSQLVGQLLSEAFILTVVAGLFAVVICQAAVPGLNALLGKQIGFNLFQSPALIAGLMSFILLTALLAGVYPAWFVSKFNAATALKPGSSAGGILDVSSLRRGLIVVQFTISAGLLIAVLLIAQQADFLRNKELGFDKNNVVTTEIGTHEHMQSFYNELMQLKGVREVSFSRTAPISNDHWWNTIGATETTERKSVCAIYSDDKFYSVYGLRLLSGRIPILAGQPVSDNAPRQRVVVNEKLLSELGLGTPQEAIGKHFWWGGDIEIGGVVADFNLEPLKYGISPALLYQDPNIYSHANIKLEPGADVTATLASIKDAWGRAFSGSVFEYAFVDHQIAAYYAAEGRLYALFRIFAALAILISCLGLWGLVAYAAQQRTHEIGIRKVLGASMYTIWALLTREFIIMVLIAIVVATPLAYYFMNDWLNNFAFHVGIGYGTFLVAGLALMALTTITVSIQTIRASLANPVASLKSE